MLLSVSCLRAKLVSAALTRGASSDAPLRTSRGHGVRDFCVKVLKLKFGRAICTLPYHAPITGVFDAPITGVFDGLKVGFCGFVATAWRGPYAMAGAGFF